MNYYNENFYKKVYLIEFYIKDILEDSFAFSVPPQSESFSYTQRISETKTFGGIVFDDYGNDVVRIKLSGTTVNNLFRKIYTGNSVIKSDTYGVVDGKNEIETFKSILQRYGSRDKLENKKVKLISLETGDTWDVLINEFAVERSKERPLSYTYSLSMTGLADSNKQAVTNKIAEWTARTREIRENTQNTLNRAAELRRKYEEAKNQKLSFGDKLKNLSTRIQDFSEKWTLTLKEACGDYQKLIQTPLQRLNEITDFVKDMQNVVDDWTNTIEGFSDVTLDTAKETVLGFEELFGETNRLIFTKGHDIYYYGMEISEKIKDFADTCHEIFVDDETGIFQTFQSSYLEQFGDTSDEIYDYWIEMLDEYESLGDELCTELKNDSDNAETTQYTLIPGDLITDDAVIVVKNVSKIVATDSDTWDSLSLRFYGTTDFASALAFYNGSYNKTDESQTVTIEMGKTVLIPFFEQQNMDVNNIYSPIGERDNYGVDLQLDDSGDIGIMADDINSINGIPNINQGIKMRLSTALDSRIKQTVYGIKSNIGRSDIASKFLISSIKETILADPRIQSIEKINLIGKGDNLAVDVTYTDINHLTQEYRG